MNRFRTLVVSIYSGLDLVERSELVDVNPYGLHNQEALTSVVLQEEWVNLIYFIYNIVLSAY